MVHTRTDAKARQNALDRMFGVMNDLERVVTEADARDSRMTAGDGARRQEMTSRFPALGGTSAGMGGAR